MQNIRDQRDLALLPEPRFISTAPAWLRRFAAGLLVVGALLGGSVSAVALVQGGGLFDVVGGAAVVTICLAVLLLGRPTDWRVWINLAATPEGVYLVARARRVVFVPWRDVVEIAVERLATRRGIQGFARLTLRLPEQGWARFGNISAIKGSGAERRYLLSALGTPGDLLAAKLKAFRDAYG